ncbi:UvrD-helicase domain-containing protein [Candidatus Nomurabacteria bacterium]|nr:UvrD-helicase domain-containing protein [Candidatus Nomurabacteria bacterium]
MDLISSLNKEQQKAVQHINGPLLIVAGAGTGKTRTLTHRIAYLVQQGHDPSSILAVTFTNKAAAEMRERIEHLLHQQGDTEPYAFPLIKTFHALGVYMMRRHADRLGLTKYFTILDRQDCMALVKRAMQKRDIDPKEWEPRKILNQISHAKNALLTPESYESNSRGSQTSIVAQVWRTYEAFKRAEGTKDFDDLLVNTYELVRDYQDIRDYYRGRWQFIHVDEYQDTNEVQFKLLQQLVNPDTNNICVVGDADQTIYTWRGATMRNMMQFDQDFPGAATIILSHNYRSTPTILEAAQCIIEKNEARIPKELIPFSQVPGKVIKGYQAMSGGQEANWIVQQLWKEHRDEGRKFSDMAILYRTNFQSRLLEEACLHAQLPYTVSGVKFFDRKEVKDVLAYVYAALNPKSASHITRAIQFPKRGIGKVSLGKILAGQADELGGKAGASYQTFVQLLERIEIMAHEKAPSELLTMIVHESGIRSELLQGSTDDHERLANIEELVSFATRYDVMMQEDDGNEGFDTSYMHNLEHMLEHISLMSEQDGLAKADQDAVRLMTIHASKGLEFDVVAIAGLEQGLFPSDMGDDEKRDPEEERRLMYVAVTRAKEQLYLSHARMRTIFGQQSFQTPSEFLFDIPDELIDWKGLNTSMDSGVDTEYEDDIPTTYLDW